MLARGMTRKEAERGPGLEGSASGRMRRRDENPAARRQEDGGAREGGAWLTEVLQKSQHQDGVERSSLTDLVGNGPALDIPQDESGAGMTFPVLREDLLAPVAAEVGGDDARQLRQTAADIEETPSRREKRPNRGQPRPDEGTAQETVESEGSPHDARFSTPAVR